MTLLSSAYLIDRASATVSASMLPTELVSGTSFPFINDRRNHTQICVSAFSVHPDKIRPETLNAETQRNNDFKVNQLFFIILLVCQRDKST